MAKVKLCEQVVEVRRVSDRVITVVLFYEDVLRFCMLCEVEDVWNKSSLSMMS